jgi:hypothetical protein
MKKTSIIALLAAAVLVAGIITAGCTQDAGATGPGSSGDSQQYTPASGGDNLPSGTGGSQSGGYAGNTSGPGGNRQFHGQDFLTNETMLNAAAGKLGVSEQDLKEALSSTTNSTNGRPNFTAAAQQLGVTQQQFMDAFGFPAGGFRGRGNRTAMPPSGQ